ncbi:MAG: hypothetical protein KDA89_25205 [Planctomycetaceae bacterium]|nr:hypothetical protein [Planctomycetaceae bacterium]
MVLLTACAASSGQYTAAQETALTAPDKPGQEMLIKNTLIAVNHGVITGNYTVLRDLGTEEFRRNNSAAALAATFDKLRTQSIDLSPILVTPAEIVAARLDHDTRQLHYTGFFATRPQAVVYSLTFREISGGWMIHKIVVNLQPTDVVISAAQKYPRHSPSRGSVPVSPVSQTAVRR